MSFSFPDFFEPTAIDTHRSWTATFDSYDQRNDHAYYAVALCGGGAEVARFIVQVWLTPAGDDWTEPVFLPWLRDEIQRVAATGKTNTSYSGTTWRAPHR
jgi:hypothetical protein